LVFLLYFLAFPLFSQARLENGGPAIWSDGLSSNEAVQLALAQNPGLGEIAAAEQRLAAEIRLLHARILLLNEQIASSEESVNIRERMVSFLQQQVNAGVKSALDLGAAQLALADMQSLPEAYRSERELCLLRMTRELNLPAGTGLKIVADANFHLLQPRRPEIAALVEKALANRGEIAAASSRVAQGEAALDLKSREQLPWISFLQIGRRFDLGSSDSWGLRIGVSIPLFGGTRGRALEAAMELDRRKSESASEKQKVSIEVDQTVAQLKSRYGQLESLKRVLESISLRDIETAREAVNAGRSDEMQVPKAEARHLQRRQSYLSGLMECRRPEIELDRLMGFATLC
jgi:outer membrane protein TolC